MSSKWEDEDGIDGPWERAMDAAIRNDARIRMTTSERYAPVGKTGRLQGRKQQCTDLDTRWVDDHAYCGDRCADAARRLR